MNDRREQRAELQDVVEDATGFNLRSLKTIWHLIILPRRVFEDYAARARNYTPAIRLWFGLIGIQVLISALWGGWPAVVEQQLRSAPAAMANVERLAGGRTQEFFEHYGAAIGFGQPLIVAFFTGLSVFVLGWFRPNLSGPARLNIALGVLVVGSIVSLATLPVLMMPEGAVFGPVISLAVMVAYFITVLRGSRGVLADTALGVWVKSTVYTLVLSFLVIVSGVVTSIIALTYAATKLAA